MKLPPLFSKVLDWLEPPGSRLPFEPPPGVGRFDLRVALALGPSLIFTALVFAGPLLLAPGSTGDLSGSVGVVDNAGAWGAFGEPAQWIYRVGDVACHTKASRSFEFNGNQMPFCARDVAIFAGLSVGLALCLPARSRTYRAVVLLPWWSYLALLVPIALDGGMQDVFGFESDNLRRVLTGVPAGLAIAFALVFIAYESHFASRRPKGPRAKGRGRPAVEAASQPQGAVGEKAGGSTAAWGSNAVESAPTEKKNALRP
ncbi:MAG TPA: DUF2085 domain-containing protein [Candidatus Thermoplasmatota archaeon]|nr:DUF2085 domain-containing protein [Candidatus Thermoplasmatota archaeon]